MAHSGRGDAGVALTADGKKLSGMGVVFQDYDNDGRRDIVVASYRTNYKPSFIMKDTEF